MNVALSRPYHGLVVDREWLRLPDRLSAFKVYFVSILGRREPARYEWEHCPLRQETVMAGLAELGLEGIGFITAFPHITKVFCYDPNVEVVLKVRAFQTESFAPIDLDRGDGAVEFACYAEAVLASDEFDFWAEAESVSAYLERWSSRRETPIANHRKLRAHFHGPEETK